MIKKNRALKKESKLHDDNIIIHDEKEYVRLNKYISDSGFTSRRDADKLIEQGLVTINSYKAELGSKVKEGDIVKVRNKVITNDLKKVYIMLHKPTGITCTNDLRVKGNIRTYVGYHELIFPIGRLDKDSTGLILLTNDGDIVNKILRSENNHEKEYVVTVDKDITQSFVSNLEKGVKILNQVTDKMQMTKNARITKLDDRTFKIIISEGLNRQIRRMTETQGYKVKSLKRIRIMNVKLGDLKVGEWRYLKSSELRELDGLINKKAR